MKLLKALQGPNLLQYRPISAEVQTGGRRAVLDIIFTVSQARKSRKLGWSLFSILDLKAMCVFRSVSLDMSSGRSRLVARIAVPGLRAHLEPQFRMLLQRTGSFTTLILPLCSHPQKQKEAGWHTGPWWIRSFGHRVLYASKTL